MVRKAAGMIISISVQLIFLVIVIMLVYHAGAKGFEFGQDIFAPQAMAAPPGQDMIVIIESGDSAMDVGKLLENKGLIKDKLVFFVQSKLYKTEFYPGTYTLNTSMTSEEMLEIFTETSDEEEE